MSSWPYNLGLVSSRPSALRGSVCRATIFLIVATTTLIAGAATDRRAALDESDRAAFRAWFTYLADAQFERRTDDVTDCASLVRHAYREALRAHTPAWFQAARLPRLVLFPDVRQPSSVTNGAQMLFRVSTSPERFAEFADAETIVRFNARRISRDARAAQPGDLLYFRHEDAASPSHLMVVVGASPFDRERNDWLVYHTGPEGRLPGEVRKVSLADLERHPSPRWRPLQANREFAGVYRLSILDQER